MVLRAGCSIIGFILTRKFRHAIINLYNFKNIFDRTMREFYLADSTFRISSTNAYQSIKNDFVPSYLLL